MGLAAQSGGVRVLGRHAATTQLGASLAASGERWPPIKEHGGVALVQDLDKAKVPGIPHVAHCGDHPDAFVTAEKSGDCAVALCSN
ncbi:hypothetical protein [Methylobacterium oxalidis]|uniref:hypothetical protein n=1 Tax=Methylobacterium oxalidis TaxID=944322 RepID=UPI0033148891